MEFKAPNIFGLGVTRGSSAKGTQSDLPYWLVKSFKIDKHTNKHITVTLLSLPELLGLSL